jgi:phosphatidylglycerol:prolipoprotein diacylglycerol transferase
MQIDGIRYGWPASQLPEVALPVRPAQIISSLSALGICLGLLALSPFCRRDGLLVVAGFAGYAVVRFGLEMIRNDEPGQFGTGLTISQLVSLVTFSGALVLLWVILRRQPQNFPPSGSEQPA